MGRNTFLRSTLLFLSFASPAILYAQFQQPTDEELKMTADPKAPGADAVYLYREETTDDATRFWTRYERIKVLTEKGKELATVHIPYVHGVDTIADVQGRTIHADGTVISCTDKPSDLVDFKVKGFQVDTIVFTLPSVEVGSILEFRVKVRPPETRMSRPVWDVQQPYFVRKEHFSFHPRSEGIAAVYEDGRPVTRLNYSAHLAPDAKVNYVSWKDTYSIDLTDVPAIPEEDWMPPLNTMKYRVEFYYTNALSGPAFWADAGQHWATVVLEFTNPSGLVKKAAADLVAASDSDEQKARKLYAAVQKLDNTDFSRRRSDAERKAEKIKEIQTVDDIWKNRSGTKDEIALLYVALGRATGLKVWPAKIAPRNHRIFDNSYLSMNQLEDTLVIVEVNGKDVYLDPGQKMAPFGSLSWTHYMAGGIRLTSAGAAPVLTPTSNYKADVLQRVAQLFIDPAGALTGSISFIFSGPDAIHWRQIALENDQGEAQKQFNESIHDEFPDGVLANFDHFLALDDYEVNLIAIVKVRGDIATITGKRMFLPGFFFQSRSKHPFVSQERRITPIDVHFAKTEEDDVTYHLPPGRTLESSPSAATAAWPDHALLKIAAQANGDSVNVTRTLVYNFTLLEPKDYPSLRDFYQKVATTDQQQIVLTASSTATGN